MLSFVAKLMFLRRMNKKEPLKIAFSLGLVLELDGAQQLEGA
jgi:hypothetical protein